MDQWLKVSDAARIMSVNERTVRRHVAEGKLESRVDEKGVKLVKVSDDIMSDDAGSESDILKAEIASLKAQLQGKDETIRSMSDQIRQLSDSLKTQQAITMQAQKALDQQQQLNYAALPWWKRWRRKALPAPGDVVDMEPDKDKES